MAPPGALGGAWCSGARGSRVSVCCALRASARLDSVHSRVSGTSRSRHSPRNRAPGRWRQRRRSGALGGARCSGARGSRVSVCGALRDSTQCICERLEPAEIATDSAIEHPGDGATGGARGPQVLRCSCTLASVLLATGVELSMRMCEHPELIGAAAVGKIASCRQFPPFRSVLILVLVSIVVGIVIVIVFCTSYYYEYVPLRLENILPPRALCVGSNLKRSTCQSVPRRVAQLPA